MPPAIIAAGVAAVGTIGGALISSHAQKSAADQAMQSQDQATAVQLQLGQQALNNQMQLGQQSLGLNQALYNSNYDTLSPYVSRGNVAGSQINALLGLPNATAMKSPLETKTGGLTPIPMPTGATGPTTGTTGGTTQTGYTGPSLAQIYAMKSDGIPGNYAAAMANYMAQSQPTGVQQAPVVSQAPVNALSPTTIRGTSLR